MRLIEVDSLKEKLDKIPARSIENADGRAYVLIRLSTVLEIIKQLPSAQPERTRGKWEKGVGENGVTTSLFCSECNYENTRWYDWNYCPNCGAKIERSEE